MPMNPLRLAIVVQGRFHMFDLARELSRLGHHVTLFTNYPESVVRRFGCERVEVVSYLAHGVGFRVISKVMPQSMADTVGDAYVTSFARWACKAVRKRGPYDAVLSMSGVAKELFEQLPTATIKLLHRGSSHIREQYRLLYEESVRTGFTLEKPSELMLARETAEYRLATNINVLSPFAFDSFVKHGVPASKLNVLSLGVDVQQFSNPPEAKQARLERIHSGGKLRLLCVGSFCLRKGAALWDEFLRTETAQPFDVRFVGEINTDSREIYRRNQSKAEFVHRVPQHDLPKHYAQADLFSLPSVEDGFAAVVTQALASGLPVLTTTTCGASSHIADGVNGWVVPPSNLKLFGGQLAEVSGNREALATMCGQLPRDARQYDWSHMAEAVHQQLERLQQAQAA
jgi:glycosyltransferase involved in cell wall biosynthesis